MDRSFGMLKSGQASGELPIAVGDLRALPYTQCFDFVTCLFDSLNFLLTLDDLTAAFHEIGRVLNNNGMAYFDVVTEQMVIQHFADQEWTEKNGPFTTKWSSQYWPKTGLTETKISVNTGEECSLLERIYHHRDIETAIKRAGLAILGQFDAHNWKFPKKRTIRVDWVIAKNPTQTLHKSFSRIRDEIRIKLK